MASQEYARQVTVIETVTRRGLGRVDDPVRLVTRWWTLEGELLAERDPERVPLPVCGRCGLVCRECEPLSCDALEHAGRPAGEE